MKGQKGEGTKQNQLKGAAERGPLFPRLHVNETEKAGPKAPPRNKMALYEQFTVPSHRFAQPSQKPATAMYQQQYGIRELGYPYVPHYMPSGPNHGVPMYAQPSHNTSSSGVISSVVVNEELWRNTPRHHKAGKSSPGSVSRHSTEATADCSVKCLPKQKDKAAIVPAQSSLTNQAEESTSSFQNAQCDLEGPHITDITESLQEALSTVEVGTECTGPDVKSPRDQFSIDSARSTRMIDEGKLKQGAQCSIFETLTQPTKGSPSGPSDNSTVQSCLQIESSRDESTDGCVTQALKSHAHRTSRSGTFLEPKSLEERMTINADCQSFLQSENQVMAGPQSAPVSAKILENNVHKNAFKNFTTDVGKVDNRVGRLSKPSIASPEELKHIQNRNSETSQTSQCGTGEEGDCDGLIVPSTSLDPMWIIKPKDVIRAVGQQQFWKARKKLLRQQRIFSDQVFQLHKLIKIQQLLAETPGTLLDEEMHFETREEYDASAPLADRANNSSEDVNKVGFDNKDGSKDMSDEAEGQPKNKWRQTQADGKLGLGSSIQCMPELSSVGVSAWGYPSLGPWAGPMAAQGGPFHYQAFTGALPPGSAFGMPFGPTLPGSVASMMSFGIPFCDRRHELPAEVDANYGPSSTAFKHDGSGTVSINSNHVSNDFAASWYFAQYNHLNSQRLLAGKDAPTGSGASVNKSSATAQAVKASCFPGLSYQWGLNCQAGPLNTDGLESSAHHSENSSPCSATRLNCRTSSSTPSTPSARSVGLRHQDAGGVAQNLDPAIVHGLKRLDQYGGGKKSAEKEKLVTRTLSQSKCQKEAASLSADCPLSDGNDYSSDLNPGALELFPLVPSLSSNGCSGGRVLKTGEEGQGGVIRAVPRRATAASKSAAGILLSLQRERQK